MRHGIYLPPFGGLADPHAMLDIGRAADEQGWDGLFLWDHVLPPVPGEWDIADPWVMLAAVAGATRRIRLGPLVTPLPRRRIAKLAREAVTLDHLSNGRLIQGLGLGVDTGREYSAFGEPVDPVHRGKILDEGAELLTRLWSGEVIQHQGLLTVDGVRVTPTPVQQPRIPVWFGTVGVHAGPVKRAARYDGVFPIDVDAGQLTRIRDLIVAQRGSLDGFDIAVMVEPGTEVDAGMRGAGATWVMHSFSPGARPDQVLELINRGRPGE